MIALWNRWVRRAARPVDVRPYAIVRILLPICVIVDQLSLAYLGMADDAYRLFADGGLSSWRSPDFVLTGLGPDGGMILLGVVLVSMAMVALGVGSRPASVIAVLAYAQLGALHPGGDRAIDRIIRTTLLLLVFTRAHRCYTLPTALGWRERVRTTPGWVRDAFHLWLTLMYLSAGVTKISAGKWLSMSAIPELWRVLTNPVAAYQSTQSPVLRALWPVLRLAGAVATLNELLSPLLLTRWAKWWALVCATMHLGVAFGMKLGMFSWGMLSLYPILFAPWLVPVLDRIEARLGWEPPPDAPSLDGAEASPS